ncbi:predicted protein [Sclerotinia sclerotiorum 1980 UF-70]|uniref:Secreted protein n=1 Tax=Sclerotinia sclerotiorum (strain ATCC 18683 / 1980 / Ss-1) TaxID=665079 RepID=A7EDR1_SCLS1|nr:predicted protein [Sclerotinia sclerotiorum 1980 UF-70]EDO00977.1 predicted protein [Sclerotinia sclerotiorum 1980 UF-70]
MSSVQTLSVLCLLIGLEALLIFFSSSSELCWKLSVEDELLRLTQKARIPTKGCLIQRGYELEEDRGLCRILFDTMSHKKTNSRRCLSL